MNRKEATDVTVSGGRSWASSNTAITSSGTEVGKTTNGKSYVGNDWYIYQ